MAATDWYRSFKQSLKSLDPVAMEARGNDELLREPEGTPPSQAWQGSSLRLWSSMLPKPGPKVASR